MEIVKGRAVSRPGTGYDDVAVVVEAVVDLADYAATADAARLQGVREVHRAADAQPEQLRLAGQHRAVRRHPRRPARSRRPTSTRRVAASAFNAMDRTVHRRPGYAFALARSSNRISKYEYMSGENLMPWFQGDGAHYLYLSRPGPDAGVRRRLLHHRLAVPRSPGVTAPVETAQDDPRALRDGWYDNPAAASFTSSSESQNTYVYFPRGTNPYSGGATPRRLRRGRAGAVRRRRVRRPRRAAGRLRGLPQRRARPSRGSCSTTRSSSSPPVFSDRRIAR